MYIIIQLYKDKINNFYNECKYPPNTEVNNFTINSVTLILRIQNIQIQLNN